MSSVKGRLRRLEAARRGGPCPSCRLTPGGPGYIVIADGEGAAPLDRDGRPVDPDERCPGCGRFAWFVIRVVEVGPAGEPEGEGVSVGWPM